ncbi:DUF427 domain-containing protein [Nitratireductor thuwali]|uniref:DUF427 domain-containing protein n=1 Tax=Nitratireductor thuwali TaxID=2267699 RepID=A0ABY5MC94_9HYPH|nr:hypothetical protein NTH_00162 [Nitratireductor thuwali]
MNGTRQHLSFEPSPKRIRAIVGDEAVADSVDAVLLLEKGHMPVYYFPRRDVRLDLMERTDHATHCPFKGDASYWNVRIGTKRLENAAWSYESPTPESDQIKGHVAFYWDRLDRRFEEDEEVFGHPRDPYHRIDVRPSSREVKVVFAGQTVARTHRALYLFETGLPTRYYIPPGDVRSEFLVPSQRTSICPYKGTASYWSLKVDDEAAENAVWAYENPLPECPRIKGHFCFYPEQVEQISVARKGLREDIA